MKELLRKAVSVPPKAVCADCRRVCRARSACRGDSALKTVIEMKRLPMFLLMVVATLLVTVSAVAAPFAQWLTVHLEDGRSVRIWGEGDEYSAHFESEDGHAVVYDGELGSYVYAEKDAATGALVPTGIRVGDEARNALRLSAIPLHVRDTSEAAKDDRLRRIRDQDEITEMSRRWDALKKARRRRQGARNASGSQSGETPGAVSVLPQAPAHETVGTVVGLALLIDFPSENGSGSTLAQQVHPNVTKSDISDLFNAETFSKYGNSCSVRKYFKDVSCGNFCYTNIVVGWFTMPYPRSYYDDPTRPCGECARPIVVEAFRQMREDPQYSTKYEPILRQLTLGSYSAPKAINVYFAGESASNWNYGLWAHKSGFGGDNWGLAWYTVSGEQRKIWQYQITPITSTPCIGTICHESGHMVCDFPDLYRYDLGGSGVGRFCLMDGSVSNYDPQYINPYLRAAAGWIVPKELPTSAGWQTITCNLSDVWKRTNPNNEKEYYLIENRRKKGHDAKLPGEGILIWRCNEERDNTDSQYLGCFAGTSAQYRRSNELSLEQADGAYHFERDGTWGTMEDTWHAGNVAGTYGGCFDDASVPCAKWEDASSSGLALSQFSSVGDSMSFYLGKSSSPSHSAPDLCFVKASGYGDAVFLSSQSSATRGETVFTEGDPIYLYCRFGNHGDAAIATDYRILHEVLDASGMVIHSVPYDCSSSLWLSPGEDRVWTAQTFAVPQDLPVGNYVYRCTLDSRYAIAESDESNNAVEISFSIVAAVQTYAVAYRPGSYSAGSEYVDVKVGGVSLTLRGVTYSRVGYTQTGWSRDSGGGTRNYLLNASYAVDAAMTLYPFWTANTYSVTLNRQNGNGGTSSVTATYGKMMPGISRPELPNYDFGGYFTGMNGSGTKYYNADGTSARIWDMAASMTLYAYWIPAASVPDNDNFASAKAISGASGSVSGSNVGATMQSSEPVPSAQSQSASSVWYTWTAPASGMVTFDMVAASFDTVLGVYTGTSVASLSEVDSDDDGGSGLTNSRLSFQVVSGTAYRIAVYGYRGASGNFTIEWRLTANSGPGTLAMMVDEVPGGGLMKVTVKRVGGADGRVAVKLKTQDSATVGGINGVSGRDFQYVKEYLVWEDGDASDKVVYVPTYVTDADEAVTLRLKLSVQTTGDYADCKTPELASGGKVIASILPAAKGTIAIVEPDPLEVAAGETLVVKVRRTGGSSGRVAVKLKTQDAATVGGISALSGQDFQYVKKYLVWEDGDSAAKSVSIPTYVAWWPGDPKTFRLKLSVQTTGDYADCVTPTLADGGKVVASIYPNEEGYPGEVFVKSVQTVNCCTMYFYDTVYEAPFWGYAGDTLRVTVGREGGGFGRVAVKVKTQDASTVGGINALAGRDFQYVKEVLVWDDGEIGDKVLEIPTFYVGGTAYPRTFRLKFSAQTADGYADCVTPEFVDPKVVIGLME